MPLLRLRKTSRMRSIDDDDWGTSYPEMEHQFPPPQILPSTSADQIETHSRDVHSDHLEHVSMSNQTKKQSNIQKLKQQQLKSYTCTFSPRCVISLYFFIALIFIPFGSAIIAGTSQIKQSIPIRYSETCPLNENDTECLSGTGDCLCELKLTINETIPAPSYLYYSLANYHQNAREYAKSRSDIMNQGKVPSKFEDVATCEPNSVLYKNGQEPNNFDPKNFIYPCGLTANSFFNDTITLCRGDCTNATVEVEKNGIAWETDAENKFRRGPEPLFADANDLLEDPDFVVWMRLSTFSNFDKLYRIILEDINPGTYVAQIEYKYPVKSFGGTKSFYITTTKWFGAPNPFLGVSYLVVGVTALFIACTLLFNYVIRPRPMGMVDSIALLREELAKYDNDPWQAIDEED